MRLLAAETQIVAGLVPVNMATGANTGDFVSLVHYKRIEIIIVKAAGASGEPPTITLTQAQDVAGTGAKPLNFTRIDVKDGADLTTIGTFTTVRQASGNTYTPAAGDTQTLAVIHIETNELDCDGGFCAVKASIADVGSTAQLGTIVYILFDPRFTPPPAANA